MDGVRALVDSVMRRRARQLRPRRLRRSQTGDTGNRVENAFGLQPGSGRKVCGKASQAQGQARKGLSLLRLAKPVRSLFELEQYRALLSVVVRENAKWKHRLYEQTNRHPSHQPDRVQSHCCAKLR